MWKKVLLSCSYSVLVAEIDLLYRFKEDVRPPAKFPFLDKTVFLKHSLYLSGPGGGPGLVKFL